MKSPVRLLLVDDHPMIAKGIALCLEEEGRIALEIVGCASSADELIELQRSQVPDLIIADINMPGKSGLDMISEVLAFDPDIHILIFSMHLNAEYAKLALGKGARGYVMKEAMPSEILTAIETILSGGIYLSPAIARSLSSHDHPAAGMLLTEREAHILGLIASGATSKTVARELGISHRTVETHRRNIHAKLGSRSMAEAITIAREKHILSGR